MNNDYGMYSLCFRLTRAKTGSGYDVRPFSTDAVTEPTTFAQCCEFRGDDGVTAWMEVSSRTVNAPTYAEGKAFDDGAGKWLTALWKDWLEGREVEPWIAEQFQAIREQSQWVLGSVYGEHTFSRVESEVAAEEWHEGLKQSEFWNRILPANVSPSGLVGSFGIGDSEATI